MVNVIKARLVLPIARHTDMLKEYLDRVEAAPVDAERDERVRLTIIGNCVLESAAVSQAAEEAGARIVADNLCYGLRLCWETVDDAGDPMDAIARHYLTKIPCPGKFPMETLANKLSDIVVKIRQRGDDLDYR